MNPRYNGPAVLPPAAEVRKRVEAHLEALPVWEREPRGRERATQEKKAKTPRKPRRRTP